VRVVVAHRHAIYAEALGRLLESLGVIVAGAASDDDSLVARLSGTSPDVLLLDGRMAHPKPPAASVVVLAERLDDRLHDAVCQGDVDGVVLSSCTGRELASAIRQVAAGHAVVPAGWLGRGGHAGADDDPLDALTPRQREVLELVALGLDNDEIAARLYISRNTVKFHVRTIYGVLGVHNRVAAARVLAGADLPAAA
jgi:DNA-binding NarL/FixJ family response regulator